MTTTNNKVIEEWITTKDNVSIYTKTWKAASEPPIATVVFIHGFGEHVNRYDYMFNKFSERNIEVYGFDQRGFGKTAVRNQNPGITGGWKKINSDITEALITQRKPGIPQFLVGQSMGGGIVLNYACDGPEKDNITGLLVSSPLVEFGEVAGANEFKRYLVTLLSKVFPNLTIPVNISPQYMTHDPIIVEKTKADRLMIGRGSLKSLADMSNGAKLVNDKKYVNITSPIYFSHGSGDLITSSKATRKLCEKIPSEDKTYREWKGLYHELHFEFEKDQIIETYLQWIIDHVNNKSKS